ncbi:zinc-finger associated domain containing protein [Oryctes borbonicus]|uniref:Zinc-finger associated domain containing protein n=1 Tax=Oryctes borbonicus TaxID=1629725 RepID=A0A0T6B314_9SCAR|nr:zinc-finger associated domain containing protein [Oryctes borbonicus]
MEERANTLRAMQICRFCLNDNEPLTNIYEKGSKDGKHTVPLPLQIMACVAIEVFQNDGMPQLICNNCRLNTIQAYTFKGTCKKSDDALKLYLTTGNITFINPNKIEHKTQVIKRKQSTESVPEQNPMETKKFKIIQSSHPINQPLSSSIEDNPSKNESHNEDLPAVELEIEDDFEEEVADEQSDDQLEEDDEEEESDDDPGEHINPVLKVPQVQTDVFPCLHCERSFPLKQLLDLHMKNHNRERSYECTKCRRKFFTKYDLSKHVQTHSDEKPFPCVVCKKSFARESLLHRHEKTHVNVPKYLCTYCDRTFLLRADLDAHTEKHKKKRPFQCRICKKCFVFKQGLERHEISHSEEKPHKCNYCKASFTSPIKLMRHVTSHAGLRPYPCKRCGRTFLLSHHLTRHMRSHATKEIGQYKCDICSMSFRRKDSLINHSTIHSMVNLKCVICYTSFDNAKDVMNHITIHLSGLPYPCDKCDYSFDTQEQLEEHELKHAEMEYEEQIEQEVSEEVNKDPQDAINEEEEDENDEESDGDIAEYTITNPENPEIVRRLRKPGKIQNYAQFLKEELGSDIEDGLIPEDEPLEIAPEIKEEGHGFKPIVRIEGTKVYTRKNPSEKPKIKELKHQVQTTNSEDNKKMTTLENLGLTKQDVQALPNRQFVDMKIGDKTVRVQKLMMTKAEIEQMAKQGKIEVKGDTILLKKTITSFPPAAIPEKPAPFRHTMETIIDDKPPLPQKPPIKKTYVRKSSNSSTPTKQAQSSQEDAVNNENDNSIN